MGSSKRAGTGPSAGSTSSQVSRARCAGETRARSGKSCSSARCAAIRGTASRPRAASGRSMSFVASGDVALPWRRSIRRRIAIPRANSPQDAVSSGRCKPGEPSQARQEARSCRAQNTGGNMFRSITDEVAWVTGAGSGIGQAAAIALAKEGATVVLTGRRKEPLEETAGHDQEGRRQGACQAGRPDEGRSRRPIAKEHREEVRPLRHPGEQRRAQHPRSQLGRARRRQAPSTVIDGNLSSAFYCSSAVLPMMRAQKDGLLIHTSSMAGRYSRRLARARLLRGEARRGGDEPHHQHGGMRQRHPLLRRLPGRGRDARSSTSGPCR